LKENKDWEFFKLLQRYNEEVKVRQAVKRQKQRRKKK